MYWKFFPCWGPVYFFEIEWHLTFRPAIPADVRRSCYHRDGVLDVSLWVFLISRGPHKSAPGRDTSECGGGGAPGAEAQWKMEWIDATNLIRTHSRCEQHTNTHINTHTHTHRETPLSLSLLVISFLLIYFLTICLSYRLKRILSKRVYRWI